MRVGDERRQEITPPMPATASELKMVMERERAGTASFLLVRDGGGELRLLDLDGRGERLSVGRDASNAIPLAWDREVSRLHARLSRVAGEWVVEDDGLSRNGTFLNGERLTRSARLRDRDVLRFGGVVVGFRCPGEGSQSETLTSFEASPPPISAAEERVLRALASPWLEGQGMAAPASNAEIAAALSVSVHTVKSHLQSLFGKFDLGGLPQSRKRAALVEAAFRAGSLGG
jgi:DNA-binding CsgD family transcriptional regulator